MRVIAGNWRAAVTNLGSGVMDFFYEPAKGLVKSPKDFGKGLVARHWLAANALTTRLRCGQGLAVARYQHLRWRLWQRQQGAVRRLWFACTFRTSAAGDG